jgi:hypothetical protein
MWGPPLPTLAGCIVHTIHDTTLLVSMAPPRGAKDNDEVEWQRGRVYLHLGVRRDNPPPG